MNKRAYHFPEVDSPRTQQKIPNITWVAKAPNIGEVKKKHAHREWSDYWKYQIAVGETDQAHNGFCVKTESRIEAMERQGRHRQDYPVCRSVQLFVETGRSQIYLKR